MVEFDYNSYIVATAIGLPICFVAWFLTRSLIRSSLPWRFAFCLLVALAFCPSLPFSPHGPRSLISPAIYFLRFATDGGDGLPIALFFGAMPIVLAALGLFGVSFLLFHRKAQDAA